MFFEGMKNIFGVLEILNIFFFFFWGGGHGRCGGQAYERRTNQSSPPSLGSPCGVMSTERLIKLNVKRNVDQKTVESE